AEIEGIKVDQQIAAACPSSPALPCERLLRILWGLRLLFGAPPASNIRPGRFGWPIGSEAPDETVAGARIEQTHGRHRLRLVPGPALNQQTGLADSDVEQGGLLLAR